MAKEDYDDLIQIIKDLRYEGKTWEEIGKEIDKTAEAARGFYRYHTRHEKPSTKERVTVKDKGDNQKVVTSISDVITTPEELLKYCNIDSKEWIEVSREISKSTTKIASGVHKDLTFDEGVISGTNKRGETKLVPVVRIKLNLVRKKPSSIEPNVQPIVVNNPIKPPKPPAKKSKWRWLIGGDQQIGFERDMSGRVVPYHDRLAMSVFEQIAAYGDFDGIALLGDTIDWTEFSRYTTTPNQSGLSQSAICESYYHYAKLREAKPKAQIVQLLGNHDLRPETSVANNIKGLWGLRLPDEIELELPPVYHPMRLTSAHKLGIEWSESYPDGIFWLNDFIQVWHGRVNGSKSGSTVSKQVGDAEHSVIFGDIHRIEVATKTVHTRSGIRFVMAISPGCLCRIDGVVPGVKKRQNWQQGCAVLEFEEGSELPSVNLIPIVNGEAIYDGKIFKGEFNKSDLMKATNWDVF